MEDNEGPSKQEKKNPKGNPFHIIGKEELRHKVIEGGSGGANRNFPTFLRNEQKDIKKLPQAKPGKISNN